MRNGEEMVEEKETPKLESVLLIWKSYSFSHIDGRRELFSVYIVENNNVKE